jgi:hypothetical protein
MNIIISPLFYHFFSGRIWMGLDYELIKDEMQTKYHAIVRVIPFHLLVDSLNEIPQKSVLFYSSVYNPNYLKYIQDTIHYITLKRPDIILIPNEHQLRSLENKGYQELYKDLLNIKKVEGKYYGDINEVLNDKNVYFPFVLKTLSGALSKGVQLIRTEDELKDFQKKAKKMTLKEFIAFKLNKKNSFIKDHNMHPVASLLETNFEDVFSKKIPVVVQKFVPALHCDYKVLVFGDKYFVVMRGTRENDFRASGSGKLSWVIPPIEVLDFAEYLKNKFKVPFISLDIGIDNANNCYMFEYQGTAFGPATLTAGDKYFIRINGDWQKIEGQFNLDKEYAYAINHFINENN